MENTNKNELPRNRSKEDAIPYQPLLNNSKTFITNPLVKNNSQFIEKDDQNTVQNEISSQRKIPKQFETYKHLSNELSSKYIIKRGKNPSLRFIKGLSNLDWILHEFSNIFNK